MKVVLDANVLIAAFAGRGLCADVLEYCLYEHIIILSKSLVEEVHRNLCRKIKAPKEKADRVREFLICEAEIVEVAKVSKDACRDADDIKVLGTALSGEVDAIVSGDPDLVILKKFGSIPIFTPREFWEFVRQKDKVEEETKGQ